jgi:hypothetical protein
MTMKPPSGLATESDSESESEVSSVDPEDLSDEVMVDESDDVTVEASEDVTTESPTQTHAGEATPPPLSSLASSALGGSSTPMPASVLGVLSPSLPLPGVTAAPPPREPDRAIDEDVTTLARGLNEDVTRPAITDDDEEETKVEPAETAIHAAASRDVVATALSEQASVEREKALRKSGLGFEVPPPRRSDDVEFADPGEEDDEDSAAMISADPVEDDDIDDDIDDQEVEPVAASDENDELDDSSDEDSTAMFAKATDSSPLAAALTARRPGSPPTGSPFGRDTFGSARLPSPTPGYGSLSLSSSALAQAPAPASSPFGKLAAVPGGSPFGARATTSAIPALQIPAPSGAAAPSTEGTGLLKRVEVPLGVLGVICGLFLVVGVVIGAKAFGGSAPTSTLAARPAPAMPGPPVPGPVVQPVGPPAPGAAPTPIPAAMAATPTPTPAVKRLGEDTGGETPEAAEGMGEAPAPKPVKRVVAKPRKPVAALGDELPPAPKAAAPKPPAAAAAKPAAKPAKAGKKVWVDPFAQ